ncbi:three-helix bundle dimerization domain-containing protein [Agromyces badenianii]|uniref:three-helix bundle dimerization domain-containing protein n=1 Tax=Agromyces badenianii TaxID=2080742 RepID=UPI001F44C5DB|nr:hypothetical protein [Agromyces badenianii]
MDHTEEGRAVDEVIDRLVDRFPDLPRDHIAAVVQHAHLELEGNAVRDFVPVLVERAAKQQLKQEANAVPAPVGEAPAVGPAGDPQELDPMELDPMELDPMEIERRARERESGFLFGDLGGGPS